MPSSIGRVTQLTPADGSDAANFRSKARIGLAPDVLTLSAANPILVADIGFRA